MQALARVWRDGQKKDCKFRLSLVFPLDHSKSNPLSHRQLGFVYRFVAAGTVEEKSTFYRFTSLLLQLISKSYRSQFSNDNLTNKTYPPVSSTRRRTSDVISRETTCENCSLSSTDLVRLTTCSNARGVTRRLGNKWSKLLLCSMVILLRTSEKTFDSSKRDELMSRVDLHQRTAGIISLQIVWRRFMMTCWGLRLGWEV